MYYLGKVTQYKKSDGGADVTISIDDDKLLHDLQKFGDGKRAKIEIRVDDGRRITNDQRKKYFATVKDIADHMGYIPDEMHEYFRFMYRYRHEDKNISMSNCSVTEARHMITMALDFALNNDVPLDDLGVNRAEDIDRYIYSCIMNRKCVCCGKNNSDFHHVDKVGMGRNRKKIVHKGMRGMTLCREHHNEVHRLGEKTFEQKHKVYGIKLDDRAVKKLNLNS